MHYNNLSQLQYLNEVYAKQVIRASFDENWNVALEGDYVVYTATVQKAQMLVTLPNDVLHLITFPCNGSVRVSASGVTDFSNPHIVRVL